MLHTRARTAILLAILPLVAGCIVVRRQATPRYGAVWNWSHYPEWEPFVGQQDGLSTFSSNPRTTGLGLFYERRYDSPWSVGIFGRHNQHRLTQVWAPGGPFRRTEGTVNGWFVQPYMGRSWTPSGWLNVQLAGGPELRLNTGTFKFVNDQGLFFDQAQRTHFETAWNLGASVNVGPWNNWGVTAGYKVSDMFRRSADNNRTLNFGLWFDHVRIARNTPVPGTTTRPPVQPPPGGTRPPADSTRTRAPGDSTPAPPPPSTPRPRTDTTIAPPRPPADTTIAPPRPPRDSTPPTSAPPPPVPPSRPDSQEQLPTCCGFRGRNLTYPRLTDGRQAPGVQAAAWSPATGASNVLLPNGAFFHVAKDLVVESVGFPFDWTRHYLSDLGTTAGGMIGHRWDFTLDKRILPLGGTNAGDGLVEERPGFQPTVMYFNGQGRAEIYTHRLSGRRDFISNFGTGFSAWVTAYNSPPGAFHEIERYVLYTPAEHPFKSHPNVDVANNEAIFYVLREKNGLRYVFNCRGQLIHILSRHDYTSYGAMHPDAAKDSVRVTIEYGAPLNPLTQSPMPVRIRDTANRVYNIATRNIGRALMETNYLCRPERGVRDVPRISRLTGHGIDIEYQYRSSGGEAILEGVKVTTGSISGTTRYAYDERHRLTRLTPPKQAALPGGGAATHVNTYDGTGRVTRQVVGDGLLTWSLSYQGTSRVTAQNAAGDQREYQLRPIGPYFVTSIETLTQGGSVDGGPWVTRYEHNTATQVTRLTMPRGNVVRYEYDGANGPVTLGTIRDYDRGTTYDNDLSHGNLLAVIQEPGSVPVPDPVTITKRFEFEPLFNQIRKDTDARGSATDYEYRYTDKGEFGNPIRIQGPALTQPDGSRQALAPVTYTYNTKGQVATILDRHRGTTRYTYAGEAWYVKQVDLPGGGVRTYDVDPEGRIREEGGSFGTTRYRRDERGRVTSREVVVGDGMSNRTFFEYDLHNQVTRTRVEVRDNFGPTFAFGGETLTLPVAQLGELVTTTEYDLLDRPVREVIGGIARRFEYDTRGNVVASITPSPTGQGESRATFEYDARGLVIRREPGLDDAAVTRFEYDANMNLVSQASGPNGARAVTWEYDPFDRPQAQVDGRGTSVDKELDPNGNVVREVIVGSSGLSRHTEPVTLSETEFRYNELDKAITVRRHLLNGTGVIDEGRAFYTAAGDVARMVSAANEEMRFEYDVAGRTTAVTGADLTTRTTYTQAGLPASVTETEHEDSFVPNTGQNAVRQVNQRTTYTYDIAGRLIHQAGPGPELRLFYNSLGLLRAQLETSHGLTETRYDALGQKVLTQRGGAFERLEYLPSGHAARHVTPAADLTFQYDALGRLVETRDARTGGVTRNTWNIEGDLVQTRDPNGTALDRTFDEGGMVTRLQINLGSSTVDDDGFARTTLTGPGWETYTYDGLGRPVHAATSQGVSTSREYDGLGRVLVEVQERDGVPYRLERSYAADQSWSELLYPALLGGLRVRHLHAPSGTVRQVNVNGREVARFQYAGGERVTSRTFANGVVATYDYDAGRRIQGVQVLGPGAAGRRPTWWANTLTYRNEQLANVVDRRHGERGALISASTSNYGYDVVGRRISSATTERRPVAGAPEAVTTSGTHTRYVDGRMDGVAEYVLRGNEVVMARLDVFSHDRAQRVVSSINAARLAPAPAEGGAVVRDIAAVATLVQDNRTAMASQRFQYDRAGNLIADTSFIYSYDHANRVTRVAERSTRGNKEHVVFVYDAFGRRVYMIPGRERNPEGLAQWAPWARQAVAFVYDGHHVIGELEMFNPNATGAASLLARYVMGARSGDRLRMDRRQNDDPRAPLVTWYLHEGAQGSLALVSDSAGRQQWVDYAAASGATPFRPPNDLHTVGRSGTRSPYLAGALRVDGFSGVRYDERTRERLHDYRENRLLANQADLYGMSQQVRAFQAASLASMAAMAAVGITLVGLPSVPGLLASAGPEIGKYMALSGAFSLGVGLTSAYVMGHEYSFGTALADFGEGALMGALGLGMVKAGMGLGAIAAADYATGFWSGFIRADPTESVSDAAIEGMFGGAFGAGLGLGIGTIGKKARHEQLTLTAWRRGRRLSTIVPDASQVASPRGLNARWQTVEGEGIMHKEGQEWASRNTFTIFSDRQATTRELALERTILSHLREGTRASRLIAALILKGELKVKFRETSASRAGADGSFEAGRDYITINVNTSGHISGNPARQIAATLVHEGVHYLGGGELAAWFAHTKFLMKSAVGHSAIPGLRYLSRLQPLDGYTQRQVAMTRQGIETLAKFVDLAYPVDPFSVNPIHGSVLRAKGMGNLLGMNRHEVDFAMNWLESRGGFNSLRVAVYSY